MPSVITSRSANKQRGIPQLTIREVKREALVKAVEELLIDPRTDEEREKWELFCAIRKKQRGKDTVRLLTKLKELKERMGND